MKKLLVILLGAGSICGNVYADGADSFIVGVVQGIQAAQGQPVYHSQDSQAVGLSGPSFHWIRVDNYGNSLVEYMSQETCRGSIFEANQTCVMVQDQR